MYLGGTSVMRRPACTWGVISGGGIIRGAEIFLNTWCQFEESIKYPPPPPPPPSKQYYDREDDPKLNVVSASSVLFDDISSARLY